MTGPAVVAPAAVMQVKRLRPGAVMPVRGSVHAAGFDLAAEEATVVKAGGKAIVKTGISIAIPEGTYARLAPRSGLAVKKHINVAAGVVDFDYRGEVGVVLFNHGSEDFPVAPGDRVAQLILEQVCMAPAVEVESLDDTARGAGGFGSTGVAQSPEEPAAKRARVAEVEKPAPTRAPSSPQDDPVCARLAEVGAQKPSPASPPRESKACNAEDAKGIFLKWGDAAVQDKLEGKLIVQPPQDGLAELMREVKALRAEASGVAELKKELVALKEQVASLKSA